MTLCHRTPAKNVAAILAGGFRDGTGKYLTDTDHTGVWFADRPDVDQGAMNWPLLAIDVPADAVAAYEWVEADKGYREWLIPAALANTVGPPRLVSPEEQSAILEQQT